ncbi:hypothetical protein TNCV_2342711 [Trichonephila clavipes]|nr:hypothetical protein TNCV_2342711 [Trichonephila clavipes]
MPKKSTIAAAEAPWSEQVSRSMTVNAAMSFKGTVTVVKHRDEDLESYVNLFTGAVGCWPVRSPDLIRTQHPCDALRRAIATRKHPSKTIQGLLNEWY